MVFNPEKFTIHEDYPKPLVVGGCVYNDPSAYELLELVKLIFTNSEKSNSECLKILKNRIFRWNSKIAIQYDESGKVTYENLFIFSIIAMNFTLFKYFIDNKLQFNPEFLDLNRKFKLFKNDLVNDLEEFDALDIIIIYSEYNTLKYCLENYPEKFRYKDITKLPLSVKSELYLEFYKIKYGNPSEEINMLLKMVNHREKWILDIKKYLAD